MDSNDFNENRKEYDNGESPKGTTILILAIVGIVFMPCAVISLVMSSIELKHGYRNDSKVMAGFIISLIIVIIQIISILAGVYALSVGTQILKDTYYNDHNHYSGLYSSVLHK